MRSGVSAAWREVKTICLSLISIALAAFAARQKWLAGLALGLLGWIIYFFRDPDRLVPTTSADFILAPADGRITKIDLVDEPHFIKGPARRISIFLSLFDVHVQRIPYEGQVQFLRYQSGGFAPAFLNELRDNETNLIGLNTSRGRIVVKQIAGILARRIVCWVDLDDQVRTGQRLGLIKFGSRVEVLLPPAVEVLVEVGQQVYGSQTIVARWP
jgi:phosphatidylserine decarboxylase